MITELELLLHPAHRAPGAAFSHGERSKDAISQYGIFGVPHLFQSTSAKGRLTVAPSNLTTGQVGPGSRPYDAILTLLSPPDPRAVPMT
jgi:hypothetical protein